MSPTALGRNLPRQDWEGDDLTPGTGGHYVTCMDTAVGRAVAWATNGRITKDGKVYRAAVVPRDPNGIDFDQAAKAVHAVTGLALTHGPMTQRDATAWLKAGKGLVVIGRYSALPRADRFQAAADFLHAMFVPYINSGNNIRLYDPLDPDTNGYGRIKPVSVLWPFLASGGMIVGHVPLQRP